MDKLLEKFVEPQRWSYAIDKAFDKKISIAELNKLLDPKVRAAMYTKIRDGEYRITPPRQQKIPKDNGEFRIVYINSNVDRVFLSIVNDILFEECGFMVHKSCKSYQKGIGCGKVVQECSRSICSVNSFTVGIKADLSKYFDSVPLVYIEEIFNKVEKHCGKSKIIDVLRDYYRTDLCIDTNGMLIEHYQSLKQGCAVASFLADAMLYDMDNFFSNDKDVKFYVRYSDDLLIINKDTMKYLSLLKEKLSEKGLTLNPKKVEILNKVTYFKFLGFSIRGSEISISKDRIKTFQKEIERFTIRRRKTTPTTALHNVMNYLYGNIHGNLPYSWATSVLSVINVKEDVETLNSFVLDCLRAVSTGKRKIGGLGYETSKKVGVITRGRGKNVTSNRSKTEKKIDGYLSLMEMRNALLSGKEVYDALRRTV